MDESQQKDQDGLACLTLLIIAVIVFADWGPINGNDDDTEANEPSSYAVGSSSGIGSEAEMIQQKMRAPRPGSLADSLCTSTASDPNALRSDVTGKYYDVLCLIEYQ